MGRQESRPLVSFSLCAIVDVDMRVLALLLLLCFIGLGVFGYTVMHSDMLHDRVSCIAAIAVGTECVETGPFAIADFHASAFKIFTLAAMSGYDSIGVLLLLSSVFFITIAGFAISFLLSLTPPVCLSPRAFRRQHSLAPSLTKLIRWFSLHENSPNRF